MNSTTEKLLLWGVRIGVLLVFAAPLVVAPTMFFPYITGKNFFFRILTEIVFGVWLALALAFPYYRPRRGIVLWALAAFIAVLTIATVFGADPYHSFWSNFERMEGLITYLHLFALFLMISSVFRARWDWSLLFHTSVFVSIFVSFYGFLEKTGAVQVPGSTGERIFSRLGNPIYFGAYLLFHFFILGILCSWTRNVWLRAGYSVIFLFQLYLFLFTETRGALLGFFAGACVTLLLFVFLSESRRVRLAGGAVLASGLMLAGALFLFRESAFIQSNALLARMADIRPASGTAQSRFMIWGIAWDGLKERPLLGWGPGNFIIPYAKYYNPDLFGNEPWFDRVHNMHFEWLIAGGMLGFAAYLALLTASAIVIWQLWRRHVFDTAQAALTAGFFAAYLAQNTFVFDTIVTYLFLVLFLAFLQSMRAPADMQHTYAPIHQKLVAGMVIMVLAIGAAYIANAAPMRVARGIIEMLGETSRPGTTVLSVNSKFDTVLREGTFGVTEARERYVDVVFQASRTKGIGQQDFTMLVSKGIEELKKETDGRPHAVREIITLGKLYQLHFVATGDERSRDASLAAYNEARKLAPHYPPVYIGTAETYLAAQDPKNAAEVMDSIYGEMTRPTPFIYSLLSVSILAGDYEKATRQVAQYISMGNTPNFPGAAPFEQEKLALVIQRALAVNGDAAGRRQFMDSLQPTLDAATNIDLLLATANMEAELGRKERARGYAERVLAADPARAPEVEEFLRSLDDS